MINSNSWQKFVFTITCQLKLTNFRPRKTANREKSLQKKTRKMKKERVRKSQKDKSLKRKKLNLKILRKLLFVIFFFFSVLLFKHYNFFSS